MGTSDLCIIIMNDKGDHNKFLELVLELVQKLVHEVQMASSTTSVLDISSRTLRTSSRTRSRTEVLEPAICFS